MSTPYSDIYELFLASINDYKIDNLYNQDELDGGSRAETYMKPFLIKAIPNFTNCEQNLESRSDTTATFSITLNTDEKVILSNLMCVEWLTQEVNDIRQMKLRLTDDAFKSYAEANNMKEKANLLSIMEERADKQISRYTQKNLDFDEDFG